MRPGGLEHHALGFLKTHRLLRKTGTHFFARCCGLKRARMGVSHASWEGLLLQEGAVFCNDGPFLRLWPWRLRVLWRNSGKETRRMGDKGSFSRNSFRPGNVTIWQQRDFHATDWPSMPPDMSFGIGRSNPAQRRISAKSLTWCMFRRSGSRFPGHVRKASGSGD